MVRDRENPCPGKHDRRTTLCVSCDHLQLYFVFVSNQGQLINHANGHDPLSAASGAASAVGNQQDAAAMTNWLWQQYAAAAAAAAGGAGDQYASDALQSAATNPTTNGSGVIIYQLNADGTQTAFTQPVNSAHGDTLEPGEVRMAASSGTQNGDQGYSGGAGYQVAPGGTWPGQEGVGGEKQLLRNALVEKVREIQRLTRELEQAYALIHQLKQHNDYLQRQWGQSQVAEGGPGT
jgi:hypothetical protein